MRRVLGTLVVLTLCVLALGFYRGWFTFSRPTGDGDGSKINVQLSMDSDKVKSDVAQAKDKAAELSGQGKEEPK